MIDEIIIKVESPDYSYRYELAGNKYENSENERVERELLVEDEEFYRSRGYRNFKNGYSPSKYEILRIYRTYSIRFGGTQDELEQFMERLCGLLKVGKKTLTPENLLSQTSDLIIFLSTYKPDWLDRQFRDWERKKNLNFFPKIAALLKIEAEISEKYPVKLRFATTGLYNNTEKNLKSSAKEYPLPNTDKGNAHLVAALTNFLLDYYSQNPPIKYIKGLPMEREDILSKARAMPSEAEYLQRGLIENAHLMFHKDILTLLKGFPQFESLSDSTLTIAQGKFILKLTQLIGYSKTHRNAMKLIRPNFNHYEPTADNIRELRNNLIALKKQLKNYRYYTL
ncbi:MAG: hypothetical protein EOO90_17045 [Pedobacter sp.]|nr:MAG: hypothetical protein EOO90_17045 [Pedobacter sp.]